MTGGATETASSTVMLSKRSAALSSRGSVENKPNVSFPRDSSATLGMTENKTPGMTEENNPVAGKKKESFPRDSSATLGMTEENPVAGN